jgi:hypothetical protein
MRLRSERAIFLAVVVLLAAVAAPASTAWAQSPAARLELEAQPGCSTRDELIARVMARSTRIRFVNDGAGVPNLTARIEVGFRGVVAQLDVVEPDGRKFSRRLEAPSCAAATDALALVVAITLDPSAATADGAKPPDTSATTAKPDKPPEAKVRATPVEPVPEPEEAPAIAATRRLAVGVTGEVVSGPAPALLAGAGIEVQASLDRASLWSPAIVLTLAHLWSGDSTQADGVADFSMDLLTLDLCPVRLAASWVEARACAAGSLGRLAAQGTNTYDPMSSSRPFATAGATARVALPLGSRVAILARFGAGATLWRDAFQFIPTVFHRVASVTLVGDVGVGVQFE